jgi:hypothetical protein
MSEPSPCDGEAERSQSSALEIKTELEVTRIKNELTIQIYFNLPEPDHKLSEMIIWLCSRVR